MNIPWMRRLLSFGTGPGIVIGEKALDVVLARVRPGGVEVVDAKTIENFRERPASEWGLEYQDFLKRRSATHKAAMAVLPRREVIVRTVQLPGVTDKDAEAAIRFQLDTLHPFGDEEAAFDWRRVGQSSWVVVAVARRAVIDMYTALFSEAGVKLAGYSFSGGVIHPALRILNEPPAGGFLATVPLEDQEWAGVEVYGESEARPFFSAEFEVPLERASALTAAELRLPPEAAPQALGELLPAFKRAPEGFDRNSGALGVCAALDAACPHLAAAPNLLPLELRTASSRAVYIPTIVLAVALALSGGVLLGEGGYQNKKYLERLEAETAKLKPVAERVERLNRETAAMGERIRLLDAYRERPKRDLDTLLEVNKLLPPPAWVQQLQMAPSEVQMTGEIERAEDLLKKFDSSPLFKDSQFTTPINRAAQGELFRMKAAREEPAK